MTQPAMDASAYAEMKEMMGDNLRDIIEMCLQTFPEQLDELHKGMQNQDADAVFAAAHRLKSACGSIGAYGMVEKAQDVEQQARAGAAKISEDSLKALEASVSEVSDFLRQELG